MTGCYDGRACALGLALSLAVTVAGHAASASLDHGLTQSEKSQGFRALFDGRETDAWRAYGSEEFPAARWIVENGCLTRAPGGPANTTIDLVTREAFSDFDLRFEWRIAPGGNSGVKYFVSEEKPHAIGHEYQIVDDATHPDARDQPKRISGALYDVLAPTRAAARPVGEFNESRILVRGRRVTHWLNGVKVVEYELGSPSLQRAIAASKFKDEVHFGHKVKAPILLQDHGDDVAFRRIRIRARP